LLFYIREWVMTLRIALERSPMNPEATSCCPRWATRWRSLTDSSGRHGGRQSGVCARDHERPVLLARHRQALWNGKPFTIDLNAQTYWQVPTKTSDSGSEGIRDAFYTVKLLEDAGWTGMRHFDAHAYRTEDTEGVWDFARGCMRTYLILRDKVRRFMTTRKLRRP